MKRVRISNSSVNLYGTRVLTQGLDITQYERNPVLLYMHQRGTVVGYMKDIRVEGDDLTGEPVFDEATPLSQQLKKQFEVGSVRMVSASVEVLEMSDDPALVVEGQKCPTVTKSSLFEVSIVDIGANNDALVLSYQGKTLNLMGEGENPLPLLSTINKKTEEMDIKTIALALGLEETSSEADVLQELGTLVQLKAQVKTLQDEKEQLTLAAITATVDTAIGEKRIDASKRAQFVALGKQIGNDTLKETFAAMHPQVKLSAMIGQKQQGAQTADWKKLSDVPGKDLMQLKAEQPELYHLLYKAEYGVDFAE